MHTGDELPGASGGGPSTVTVKDGRLTLKDKDGYVDGTVGTQVQSNGQAYVIVAVEGDRAVVRLSTG